MTKFTYNLIINRRKRVSKTQPSTVKEKIIVSDNTSTDNLLKQRIDIIEKQNNLLIISYPDSDIIKKLMLIITFASLLASSVSLRLSTTGNDWLWNGAIVLLFIAIFLFIAGVIRQVYFMYDAKNKKLRSV